MNTYHVVSGGAAALPLFRFPTCYLEQDQLGFQCRQEKPDSQLKDKIMQKQVPLLFLLSDSSIKEEILLWFLYFYDNLISETLRVFCVWQGGTLWVGCRDLAGIDCLLLWDWFYCTKMCKIAVMLRRNLQKRCWSCFSKAGRGFMVPRSVRVTWFLLRLHQTWYWFDYLVLISFQPCVKAPFKRVADVWTPRFWLTLLSVPEECPWL